MALLEFRDLDERGLFEPALRMGVTYLRGRQAADGGFPGVLPTDAALSLIALARAARATGDPALRDAVGRGLARVAREACPDGGYRYDRNTWGDLRETAWVAQAVEAARRAGLDPPRGMREGLATFLDSVWQGGPRFSCERGARDMDHWRPLGICTGLLVFDGDRRAAMLGEARRWLEDPPAARLYALYYGGQAATLADAALFPKWLRSLSALAKAQERTGTAVGAWRGTDTGISPLSEGGYAGVGVVHVTAFAVLTLETVLAPKPPSPPR
jgi:hypothetical protein